MFKLNKSHHTIIYALICIIVFIGLIKWSHMLLTNNYMLECFNGMNNKTTHTVNLPINTTYSCKNMCGPYARCSITGGQCLSDIDCYGCKPNTSNNFLQTNNVIGENDAGKYAFISPNYSELTTDIGTKSKVITDNKYSQPPEYNTGVNMWRPLFDKGFTFYKKTYEPPASLNHMFKYPSRHTLSGQFQETGPLAANAYLQN